MVGLQARRHVSNMCYSSSDDEHKMHLTCFSPAASPNTLVQKQTSQRFTRGIEMSEKETAPKYSAGRVVRLGQRHSLARALSSEQSGARAAAVSAAAHADWR